MKNLLSRAGALALALILPYAALAQAPVGKSIQAPSGYLPAQAIYCDDGTGHAALCNFGSAVSGGTATITSRISYTATASGTGYSAGDQLDRVVTFSPATNQVSGYWVNVSAGVLLTGAPAAANITIKPETLTNAVFGATQSGAWNVGILGTVGVTGTFWQATQPISATSLPLPAGAATDAKLEAVRALLASTLNVALPPGAATDAKLEAIRQILAGTLPISAAALPLPAGAATDAKLEAVRALLASTLNVNLPTGAATDAKLEAIRALLAATLPVVQTDSYQPGTIAAANANAAAPVTIANGYGTGGATFTGLTASAAVLIPEGSFDGTNYVTVPVFQAGTKVGLTAITADGQYRFNASGRRSFRFRVGTVGSGTINQSVTLSVAGFDPPAANLDTNGDLRVPTVTVTPFYVSVPASQSQELLAPLATRIGFELQCAATADVGVSTTHAALTSAVPSSGGADVVIKSGNTAVYAPSYVSGLGVTAYTATAQACWGKSYARQ